MKISAVYKIVNTITGDCYVGSSKDVMQRWQSHKKPSQWRNQPNSLLYQDFQKYGLDKFRFQILAPVMPEYLKQVEQELIEMIQPTYNNNRAKGLDVERHKENVRRYCQSDKGREITRKFSKKYQSQLCSYNGETLKLGTLSARFRKVGVKHPTLEAKKYLLNKQ